MIPLTSKHFRESVREKPLIRLYTMDAPTPEEVHDEVEGKKIGHIMSTIDLLIISNIVLWVLGVIYILTQMPD